MSQSGGSAVTRARFTPGPWSFDTYNTITAGEGEARVEICSIPDHPSGDEYTPEQGVERGKWYAESYANAELLVCAPEMYRQLEKFAATAKSWHSMHGHDDNSVLCDKFCEFMVEAESLLKQAMGEQ